jgi:hypothetical protein
MVCLRITGGGQWVHWSGRWNTFWFAWSNRGQSNTVSFEGQQRLEYGGKRMPFLAGGLKRSFACRGPQGCGVGLALLALPVKCVTIAPGSDASRSQPF